MEYIISVVSLLIAFVSGIIALVAFKITNNAYKVSCKEFEPLIDFVINEKKQHIEIVNNSRDIFRISDIEIKGIYQHAFKNKKDEIIIIKFEDFMLQHHNYLGESKRKKVKLDLHSYRLNTGRSNELINYVEKQIQKLYDLNLIKQIETTYYPFSSLDAYIYLIDIKYFDLNNKERKVYYLYKTERYRKDDWLKKYITTNEAENIYGSIFDPRLNEYMKIWETIFECDFQWSAEK